MSKESSNASTSTSVAMLTSVIFSFGAEVVCRHPGQVKILGMYFPSKIESESTVFSASRYASCRIFLSGGPEIRAVKYFVVVSSWSALRYPAAKALTSSQ